MDEDDKSGLLGCLVAIVGLGAAIGGVIFLTTVDWEAVRETLTPDTAMTTESGRKTGGGSGGSSSKVPLTHVGPVSEKQVVEKAAHMDPLARKIQTGEEPIPEAPDNPSGVVAVVPDLGTMAPPGAIPPGAVPVVQQLLGKETLCYRNKMAHRGPSLFNGDGFAITYGANSYNDGDPLPRLEIFYDYSTTPVTVTVMSMTHKPVEGFTNNHEEPIAYSSEALSKTIAKWMAAVATDTCAIPQPTTTTPKN